MSVNHMKTAAMLSVAAAGALFRSVCAGNPPADAAIAPGFRFGCSARFLKPPTGETTILCKPGEYWLRYDCSPGRAEGSFNFFVNLEGAWEPRLAFAASVETGRVYRLTGGWTGRALTFAVDGEELAPMRRRGCPRPSGSQLSFGSRDVVEVSGFTIHNERRPAAVFGMFRTRELMPRIGTPATLCAEVVNVGCDSGPCTLAARGRDGVTATPAVMSLDNLQEGCRRRCEWKIDPGTNGIAYVDFALTGRDGATLLKETRRVVFMPTQDPDYSARAWNPPTKPTRTWHVDSLSGDDSRDGLSPQTAWRTFRNAAGLELGPGERLLLRRGCTFRDELAVSARGSAENWAEIGAYGTGMRPQISRRRHIGDRCAYVDGAACLAVRDITFCNAGSGLYVRCSRSGDGQVLVERCLAHHIEGTYFFNAHGLPEWRDQPGPAGGASSRGFEVGGPYARRVVMRDCESYQCSSGFCVNGVDTFLNRMFCHDNYSHNTSPHPFNLASRSWMTDCVFDASGWHAALGTMGVMLAYNDGLIMRGCHFLNQPDSGSPDQGGVDFELLGENCLIDRCTFRGNAGAAIEVLGLQSPQTRNLYIRGCRFDRNNWTRKNGPAEIQVWGSPATAPDIACSNGRIEGNGFVLVPGVQFYVNRTRTTNDWALVGNREFDFPEDLDRAFPYPDPPAVAVCDETWTDSHSAALFARVGGCVGGKLRWEQTEGPAAVEFARPEDRCTRASFPAIGDYRVQVVADNGTLWRTARTAVHVLPPGARTCRVWDFAKPLDAQGWSAERTGSRFMVLPQKNNSIKSFPVHLVCGDYFVVAVEESREACIVTPDDRSVGVEFSASRANAMRIRMQNGTTSRRMRLFWQTDGEPEWKAGNSLAFDVRPQDDDDEVYEVRVPQVGGVKRLKLAFSADGERVSGTCRIDYIWIGRL